MCRVVFSAAKPLAFLSPFRVLHVSPSSPLSDRKSCSRPSSCDNSSGIGPVSCCNRARAARFCVRPVSAKPSYRWTNVVRETRTLKTRVAHKPLLRGPRSCYFEVRTTSSTGVPFRLLLFKNRCLRAVSFPSSGGTMPVKWLSLRLSVCSADRRPSSGTMSPMVYHTTEGEETARRGERQTDKTSPACEREGEHRHIP